MRGMVEEVYYHFVDNFGYVPSVNDIRKYIAIGRGYKTTNESVEKLAHKYGLELSATDHYMVKYLNN